MALGVTRSHLDQAERIVLGAMMTHPSSVEEVIETGLTTGDFYRAHHGVLYAYLTSAYAAGQPTDPVALTERLLEAGQLRGELSASYLVTCQQSVPLVANAGYYARIVKEAAGRRRLAETAERLAQAADVEDPERRQQVVAAALAELEQTPADPSSGWAPIDLGPHIRGEVELPTPTVGICRSDGLRALYPGKEHSVIGEMEAGKSWWCLACAAAEIESGRSVVYLHFEESAESAAADAVGRLLALGVSPGSISHRFYLLTPTTAVTQQRLAPLLKLRPSLVILDGVNEAMAMNGWGIREEDGAAAFRQHLVRPFLAIGAATLSADHVVKDREARGRYGLGSIHKGNGISGSLIMLENAEPFGRGLRGRSNVFVTKDRPGHLRRHGEATKMPGKTFLGTLVVDDTGSRLDLCWWAPKPASGEVDPVAELEAQRAELDEQVFETVAALVEKGAEANTRAIRASCSLRSEVVAESLERLTIAGRLVMRRRGNAKTYAPSEIGSGSKTAAETKSVPTGGPIDPRLGGNQRELGSGNQREPTGTGNQPAPEQGKHENSDREPIDEPLVPKIPEPTGTKRVSGTTGVPLHGGAGAGGRSAGVRSWLSLWSG